jgi:hypothetical protein
MLALHNTQFYFVAACSKITGHKTPDNNLESHCISAFILCLCCPRYVTPYDWLIPHPWGSTDFL